MKTTNVPQDPLDSPDTPPTLFVSVLISGTFFVVFVSWILLYPLLSQVTDRIQSGSETGMDNKTRLLYIQQQENYLKSSQKLENGTRKISIDQAMDEVILRAIRKESQ